MRSVIIENEAQLRQLVESLKAFGACRVNLDQDYQTFSEIIRGAVKRGEIDAIFTIFNGRKDEFWRVTQANIEKDGIGAPVAILAPRFPVTMSENGPE
ncbi:hypothetical protein [Turneriella parva]|uniref:Uncharacterized protein n=1 Tax=Turneriella parva (strain ATCC BAA-1111 / DSM 21527 / NCTC 11395 / H) TaxID=869212 RepID=I4B6Y1_TURPD|nr:hypothetical protein [Turneriella parva]AFM13038.1 hypothetical protein Turpa_2396 [Turneriella parva DSM 21527]